MTFYIAHAVPYALHNSRDAALSLSLRAPAPMIV